MHGRDAARLGLVVVVGVAGVVGACDRALDEDLEPVVEAPYRHATGCRPGQHEICFNGKDDDCDGLIDCADPDCNPKAVCVPAPTTPFAVGITVASNADCPAQSSPVTNLGSNLIGATSCTGCSCGAGSTTCRVQRIEYEGPDQVNDCQIDDAVDSSTTAELALVSGSTTGVCEPAGGGPTGGFFTSTRWGDHLLVEAECGAPAGAPRLPVAGFATNRRFCQTPSLGAGCASGLVCAPRSQSPGSRSCLLASGDVSCPSGYTDQGPWFGGFIDGRSCGACSCGDPTGASCDGVTLQRSVTCDTEGSPVPLGFADCAQEFSYRLAGAPTPPVCAANSTVTGDLTPTTPFTLCCI